MKTEPVFTSSPAKPRVMRKRFASRPRHAITAGPPQPEVVDPYGPKEYEWPRGLFNFGNLVLAAGVLNMIGIIVLAALAHPQ